MKNKLKGYLAERKIRKAFEKAGWATIRSGGSQGPADLVCLKNKTCILIQVKSTRRKTLRVELPSMIQGFPLFIIVDFGYNRVRVFKPGELISWRRGLGLEAFLRSLEPR